jgi:uncharacterized protein (TIGR00645 family)
MRPRLNPLLRTALLGSRWGMAPFCAGLIVALLIVLAQFLRELMQAVQGFAAMGDAEVILAVLKLVDLVLVANLVLMIINAAVEIFLPASGGAGDERPDGAGIAEFAALKPKLFASISAIAAIDLLESFINVGPADKGAVLWEIAMLLAFVVSGVLLAWMDRLGGERH